MILLYPEHRPTEGDEVAVGLDAVGAAERTAARAIARTVVDAAVVEHPRRGRDIALITPIRGIICCITPTITLFSTC